MTPHDPTSPNPGAAELDAYLDGTLSDAARAAFEARLAADSELRAEVELQRRIDGRLRVLAGAPAFPGLPEQAALVAGRIDGSESSASVSLPASHPARGRVVVPAWVRVAAVVAVVMLGAWAMVTKPWNNLFSPAPSQVAADAVYNRLVRTGFEPAMVCDSDAKFLDYTAKELGTPFLVSADPGVQVIGWTYADGVLGDHAMILLAKRAETPVIVVMDRAANDRAVRVEPGSPLKVHRATLGGVVFYEIGPDAQPSIVNRLTPRS